MKVKIGFSRPKAWKPFSWLIMTAYGIRFSHVYVRFYSNSYQRDLIYQASHSIVNFMGIKVFLEENDIYKEFELEIEDTLARDMVQFAIDSVGKPYSLKEVFGLAIIKVAKLFGRNINNPFKEGTNAFVCSVLGAYIMENYLKLDVPGDYEDSDPKMLYDFLSKL